jgi:hypothetical protein
MKRIAIASLVFLFVFSLAQGKTKSPEPKKEQKTELIPLKKLEGNKISEIAENNFKIDFGDLTNVQWKRNGTFDEALFTRDGKMTTAYYDIEGNLVGLTYNSTFAEVPAIGQKEIKTRYRDYKIGPVIFFDDNEVNPYDMILYGVQFDDADTYLVELTKGTDKIVVQVDKDGLVRFFKQL